jgi:hypothetical protein
MEEIKKKIRELDVQKALLNGPSDQATIKSYFFNILKNREILDLTMLRHLNFQTTIPTTNLSLKEKCMLQLVNILFTVEGTLAGIVNLTIYALVVNAHHDICTAYSHDFASSFEDICDVDLSMKMKFLEKHGYGFLSEICPRRIRNAIAHNDFVIEEDGTVEITEKGKVSYSLAQLTEILLEMGSLITMIADAWSEEFEGKTLSS